MVLSLNSRFKVLFRRHDKILGIRRILLRPFPVVIRRFYRNQNHMGHKRSVIPVILLKPQALCPPEGFLIPKHILAVVDIEYRIAPPGLLLISIRRHNPNGDIPV